jgi:hypothetical protein
MQTYGGNLHLSLHTRRWVILQWTLSKRLAGEQDFRDFSCSPPVKENRTQPVDPALTEVQFIKF